MRISPFFRIDFPLQRCRTHDHLGKVSIGNERSACGIFISLDFELALKMEVENGRLRMLGNVSLFQ